jgi:hypothetical protein
LALIAASGTQRIGSLPPASFSLSLGSWVCHLPDEAGAADAETGASSERQGNDARKGE